MAVSFSKNDNPIFFQGRSLSSCSVKDGNNLCPLIWERKDNATLVKPLDRVRRLMVAGDGRSPGVVRMVTACARCETPAVREQA
jgi:hypothetical protein